ncbi:glycosyltransferase family 2 protein [Epilithonimonas arachidiradicis]|uniref:GT2 family glycosyltransferase n=1 Tax=Epilithonimonas arachidiradicis TaxID=1617282 RepID=A0A420DCP1_9FLAO|nr:glycosyltransferase [Epilithonimonas arachidiradicis]RKE89573.1 GT2 family glycosyltransferase [Epilithonimonas arachidiradicis]GGG43574.1 glycosyl transferase [Epilithonimonas arachidiradicis]
MKLSICIPVYNFDVNDLVNDLSNQIVSNQLDAEIILIDDASTKEFVEKNKLLESKVSRFIFLDKNIGRSKIRNLFTKYSTADYLLFLDCDGKIISQSFIKNYFDFINEKNPEVIFGGRKVSDTKPDSEFGLRWKFATERENLPVKERIKTPYSSFQTNNFIVRKTILEKVPFNESITQYGYEDLIFAKDLFKLKIKIDHIDNPVFNNDVESNSVFLEKADQSAKSLSQLIKKDKDVERISRIKLARAYFRLKKTGGIFLYRLIYKLSKSYIEKKLLEGNASLKALDFYKLGQLIGYMNKD